MWPFIYVAKKYCGLSVPIPFFIAIFALFLKKSRSIRGMGTERPQYFLATETKGHIF